MAAWFPISFSDFRIIISDLLIVPLQFGSDVVKGGVRDQKEKTEKTKKEDRESTKSEREHVGVQVKPRVISLTSCDTQERIEVLRGKLIGKVKCFNFLDGIANLCLCEGFRGGVVKYLGGAWVLLDVKGEEEAKLKTCSDVPTREGDNVEEDEEDKGHSEEDDHLEQLEEDASEWGTKLDLEKYSCETVVKESIQFPREKNDVDENAEEQLESDGDARFERKQEKGEKKEFQELSTYRANGTRIQNVSFADIVKRKGEDHQWKESDTKEAKESDETFFEPKVVWEEYNKQKSNEEETESEDDDEEDWEDKLSSQDSEEERSEFLSDEDMVESIGIPVVNDSNPDHVIRKSDEETVDLLGPPVANDAIPNNAISETEHAEALGVETHVGEREKGNDKNLFNHDSEYAPIFNYPVGHVGNPPTLKHDPNEESASSNNAKIQPTGKIRPKPNLTEILNMNTPTNFNRVSDKMKILLSRNTPISEKLEQMEGKGGNQHLIQYKENSTTMNDNKAQNAERRITRSQSSKWKTKDDKVEKRDTESSWGDSISTSSSISMGVANRLKEVGDACGFQEDTTKGKSQRHNYKNGAQSGKI
ncbi:hypothetical protein L2E82_37434 [Cichorium intybus]|uniref:Uncharacterized protein n=1 Tax=Cichorium intybus TaxID=13427 RepID=A0ACB9ADG7_CICIN|nr:hypothetical protein L2E82_37434 [Cichorium intybus]